MQYVRIYSDVNGVSHFEDVEVELSEVKADSALPAHRTSPVFAVTSMTFLVAPVGWRSDWHCAPARGMFFVLSGEIEIEVSDGAVRRFPPGSTVLRDDTTGAGHRTRVVSQTEAVAEVIELSDD